MLFSQHTARTRHKHRSSKFQTAKPIHRTTHQHTPTHTTQPLGHQDRSEGTRTKCLGKRKPTARKSFFPISIRASATASRPNNSSTSRSITPIYLDVRPRREGRVLGIATSTPRSASLAANTFRSEPRSFGPATHMNGCRRYTKTPTENRHSDRSTPLCHLPRSRSRRATPRRLIGFKGEPSRSSEPLERQSMHQPSLKIHILSPDCWPLPEWMAAV